MFDILDILRSRGVHGLESGKPPAGILIRVSIHSNPPKSALRVIRNQRGQKKNQISIVAVELQTAYGFLNQEVKGASAVMLFQFLSRIMPFFQNKKKYWRFKSLSATGRNGVPCSSSHTQNCGT